MSNNTSKEVVMCLFCGKLLCWNSICCRKNENGKNIGAVTLHARECSNSFIFVLRIKKNLIFARQVIENEQRSSFRMRLFSRTMREYVEMPTPYLDKYGEFDSQSGSQLFFSKEHYDRLLTMYLSDEILSTFANQPQSRIYIEDIN